ACADKGAVLSLLDDRFSADGPHEVLKIVAPVGGVQGRPPADRTMFDMKDGKRKASPYVKQLRCPLLRILVVPPPAPIFQLFPPFLYVDQHERRTVLSRYTHTIIIVQNRRRSPFPDPRTGVPVSNAARSHSHPTERDPDDCQGGYRARGFAGLPAARAGICRRCGLRSRRRTPSHTPSLCEPRCDTGPTP